MKTLIKSINATFWILLLTLTQVTAQGIEFFHGSYEEALEESKSQGKLIFVDAYAEWCGPCKRMSATVFKDDKVGEFYNQNFINMKIDMEKGEGPKLARKYGVRAYPTLFFLDEKGTVVAKVTGGRQTKQFLQLGENALKKYDKSGEYAAKYEEGDRSPELLRKYGYALLAAKKEHLKIANEYFETQKDLTQAVNLNAIFDFTTEADSRIFDLLIKHKAAIGKLKSETVVFNKIESACLATARKAADYKFENLLEEAKLKMKANYPQKSKEFSLKADMIYGLGTTDAGLYMKACKKYLSKYAKNNATEHHNKAQLLIKRFSDDKNAMKMAEKWSKKAAENGGLAYQQLTYAKILYANGKSESALRAATKAKELAVKEKKPTQSIDNFLKSIKP
ncbi:MAG: thioredoxin family protein [Saprospiraceae bacterium]